MNYKTKFLEKVLLGHKVNFNDPKSVIDKCIRLAYKDMLTAGRYYISKEMSECCSLYKDKLEKHKYVFSRKLIDDTCDIFGDTEVIGDVNSKKFVTRFGLSQKLVNMTYKYFYVFYDYLQKDIDFSNCDCPLDSIILRKLPFKYTWSKITKKDYEDCQQKIKELLNDIKLDCELQSLSNLAFDFLNW